MATNRDSTNRRDDPPRIVVRGAIEVHHPRGVLGGLRRRRMVALHHHKPNALDANSRTAGKTDEAMTLQKRANLIKCDPATGPHCPR